MSILTYSAKPQSLINSGDGIPWQQPQYATSGGNGSGNPVTITSVTISGNVVTFTTANQPTPLVAGQVVNISGMVVNTFLSGAVLTVLPSGLSATQFSANFTHPDIAHTTDAGLATPTTQFAFAQNMDGAYTPGPGQYVIYSLAEGPWSGGGTANGDQNGYPCSYEAFGQQCSGFGGASYAPRLFTSSPTVTVPTLPTGANIVGIYPVALASKDQQQAAITLTAYFANGNSQVFNMTGAWEVGGSIGTDPSLLTTGYFQLGIWSTDWAEQTSYWGYVQAIGFAIVYDFPGGGTPIPANQLQTLQGTDCGFSIRSNSLTRGITVEIETGISYGTTCDLQVQLTLAGTPVGTAKPITVGPWATSYTLGGATDLWGTTGFSGNQINGSNGLGVNVSGTLADNTQVNLNSLQVTVAAKTSVPTVFVRIGTTRIPTV